MDGCAEWIYCKSPGTGEGIGEITKKRVRCYIIFASENCMIWQCEDFMKNLALGTKSVYTLTIFCVVTVSF